MDEKVPLQSIVNFRDVGIATGGSAALPAGRLYRCYDIGKYSFTLQARHSTTHADHLNDKSRRRWKIESIYIESWGYLL